MTIPKGFIENIYELTHCDMDELNNITCSGSKAVSCTKSASSPKCNTSSKSISESASAPSTEMCVKFDRKPAKFLLDIIKNAAKNPHNYEFFTDIKNTLTLPPDTSKQIQSIFHEIVMQSMSSPNHKLLQYEKTADRYDRYVDSLPNESTAKSADLGQSTIKSDEKPRLKSDMRKYDLLERAQRAHFVDHDYRIAKKLYTTIVQKYLKTDEYYISCLNLLSLYHSALTKRNFGFGETPIERRISGFLNDTTVWDKICEIFDNALLSPNGNLKRKRTGKVGDTYKKSTK